MYFVFQEMRTILENERGLDCHQSADAFVLVLLTHGSQGSVYGIDGEKVPVDAITSLFDGCNCPQLQNKPKLFFIQACQGREFPHSVEFVTVAVWCRCV